MDRPAKLEVMAQQAPRLLVQGYLFAIQSCLCLDSDEDVVTQQKRGVVKVVVVVGVTLIVAATKLSGAGHTSFPRN